MDEKKDVKAQSPELSGGAGFTFESQIGGSYLAALLGEGYAPGFDSYIVSRVAFQQRSFGEPLDDLIVDGLNAAGEHARLSLQAKSDLTISIAQSNKDFRDIIRDSWLTYQKSDFRKNIDRYGAAVGNVAKESARTLRRVCELARESDTSAHFEARFVAGGSASADQKELKRDIVALLEEINGKGVSADEVHMFFAHFVLIEFDFMHAGSASSSEAMTRLRECLRSDQANHAPAVWSKLCSVARESAGKAGAVDRARLLREVSPIARLRGAVSLRADLEKIAEISRICLEDIQQDVGGKYIDRRKLTERLDEVVPECRFVQIVGLPGSGKSVLLRQRVEADLASGPVMLLKSDRLEGKSWSTYAKAVGLSDSPLESLLSELGATGTDTLYIDGIDRVEKNNRLIILDLLRAIVSKSSLSNWRVVVSLRDSGIEPLRNWLAEVLDRLKIGTIEVHPLDDDESETLAKAKPGLRPLLFGPPQVSEIVRRPFFAKILVHSSAAHQGQTFEPKSEIDLIENWWARGGYSTSGQDAIDRQRALINLASVRARRLGQPMPIAELSPQSRDQLDALAKDGILQHVRLGHTVRFSHDIFFEWSTFHALVDCGENWLDEVRTWGEPPAIARVVELLSQSEYREGKQWTATLQTILSAKMRSQWIRAWLLGPIGLPAFSSCAGELADSALANQCTLLRKALVWFQAERTVPNANILNSELPFDKRIRAADFLGWPSDLATWHRFINFLMARLDSIPLALYPLILSIFEVWQNLLAATRNSVSEAILKKCAEWLREIDERDLRLEEDRSPKNDTSRWSSFEGMGDFRQALSTIILRSANSFPTLTEDYLKRVIALKDIREAKYREIIAFSPTLALTHPQLLVDLTLKHLRNELPDDQVLREKRQQAEAAERLQRALAKPESERTRFDVLTIDHGRGFSHWHQFSYHDWESLCIDRSGGMYWPPSPLHEPFHSLFKSAPDFGLQLFTALCNHAAEAWRQLHRHDYERRGTPIALELQFPWGKQQFWGGNYAYVWNRGTWAPKPIASAFMAVESWCFSELERGRPVDDLIQQVLSGNTSVSILGTAVSLILHTERVSEAAFPIVTAHRLWQVDLERMVQDGSGGKVSLMGFKTGDEAHIAAVKKLHERIARGNTLRWLMPAYVFSKEFGERTKQAALAFKDNLPFSYEEQKDSSKARDFLLKQAIEFSESALRENYQIRKSTAHVGMVEITHVSPSASSPESVEKLENANRYLRQSGLFAWAAKCLEKGKIDEHLTLETAIESAKGFDSESLFTSSTKIDEIDMRRGAVAATAALVLRVRDGQPEDVLQWARGVLIRAYGTPEIHDQMWIPQSRIPWHPSIFVANGMASDVRNGTGDVNSKLLLLALVGHPLEIVSLTALAEIASLWDSDSKLAWAAFQLAFDLCRIGPFSRESPRGPGNPTHTKERAEQALSAATELYLHGVKWIALPIPPAPWIKREPQENAEDDSRGLGEGFGDIDVDSDDIEDSRDLWVEPDILWYSQYAANVLALLPLEKVLGTDARHEMLSFVENMLVWTNAKNAPPWVKRGRRDRGGSANLFEWTHQLGLTLGDIAGYLSLDDVKSKLLAPILELEGDTALALLTPFSLSYVCRHVYDAPKLRADATNVLRLCLDRLLESSTFDREAYRAGEFSGTDEPRIAEILMFVSVERAAGAARYVNGDWSEIAVILPLVDRFVRAAGWSVSVMSLFLTFCERSKTAYPAETFADQVLSIIGDETRPITGWNGTLIPARIASLVQFLANRETPMPSPLGNKLLQILDLLVDMGDRRSAALQLSEDFREIRRLD